MALQNEIIFKTLTIPACYHKIEAISVNSGTGDPKIYSVIVRVATFVNDKKSELLFDKDYNFEVKESEITFAYFYGLLKKQDEFLKAVDI